MAEPTSDNTAEGLDRGVEHLQSAAHELLSAARSFLDVIEDVVSDRDKLHAATASLSDVLGAAGSSLARVAERAAGTNDADGGQQPRKTAKDGGGSGSKVRRITID